MSGNCELGRGLRRRENNATEGGAGRFEKTAPDARAAPPEAHESLISRKTGAEVPLTGLSLYDSLIIRAVERSLDIYLDAVGSHSGQGVHDATSPGEPLLKIGQLAKHVGETVPTIRHWLKIGLLAPAQVTPAGYQLFSHAAIERCRRIQSLKGRRLTLTKIRDTLDDSDGSHDA